MSAKCQNVRVGLRPLNDLGPRLYQGRQGGLYPLGLNVRPSAHDAAGRAIAATIVPLNAAGNPASNGKIPLVSIGMSSTRKITTQLDTLMSADPDIAAKVKSVNAAVAGRDATDLADPANPYWTTEVPAILANKNVTKAQVQVIWLLTGSRSQAAGWPTDVDALTEQLVDVVQVARANFPNLKLCYVASTAYHGYADTVLDLEPNAYEQGFAVKALIERQIGGDVELAQPLAPWISWAGYNWTDGADVRSDGLKWICPDDVDQVDGIHPSQAGALKLAQRLLAELKGDPTVVPWFLANGAAPCAVPASATIFGDGVPGTDGLPLIAISKPMRVGDLAPRLLVEHAAPGAPLLFMLNSTQQAVSFAGGHLYVGFTGWVTYAATADANGRAEWVLPDVPNVCGVESFAQVAVTDSGAPEGYALSEGLRLVVGA